MKMWTQFFILLVVWKYVHVQECLFYQIDLVYVVDASTSMGNGNFHNLLDGIKTMVKRLRINYGNVRVGFMSFSSTNHIAFQLIDFDKMSTILEAIDNTPYLSGSKNTTNALSTMHNEMFTTKNGDRDEAPNIAIIITGGRSKNQFGVKRETEKAKKKGIDMYAVGVSLDNKTELEEIATRPENIFELSGNDQFKEISEILLDKLDTNCKGIPTTFVGAKDGIYKLGSPVYLEKKTVQSLSILAQDGSLFFSLDSGCSIQKRKLLQEPRKANKEIAFQKASVMAIDWIGFNLYFIEPDFSLHVSNIQGSKSTMLKGEMYPVHYLVLDPYNAIMFMVGNNVLFSIHMDGRRLKQIGSSPTNESYGPWTIDYPSMKLYGSRRQYHYDYDVVDTLIISCNYDGSNSREVTKSHFFVIGMTAYHHFLYAFDIYGTVTAFNISNFNEENSFNATRGYIRSVAVYDPEIQKNRPVHKCMERPAVCSDMCLLSPVKPFFKCACPNSFTLSDDKRKCIEDPCALMSRCDQKCERTEEYPFYKCSCHKGYYLDYSDNKTCIGDVEDILYFASGSLIKRLNTRYFYNSLTSLPIKTTGCTLDNLVIDPVDKRIILTSSEELYRSHSKNSSSKTVMKKLQHIESGILGIGIDWLRRILYISRANRISKIDLSSISLEENVFVSDISPNGNMFVDIFHSMVYATVKNKIIQINIACYVMVDRFKHPLDSTHVKCHSHEKVTNYQGRVIVNNNNIITCLTINVNDGCLYFVSGKKNLYELKDGKISIIKIKYGKIFQIASNGNAIYLVQRKKRRKVYLIRKIWRRDSKRKTLRYFYDETRTITVETFQKFDNLEICPDNVTDCLGVEGGCQQLDIDMICDRTTDCYGGFDEFYCCYNSRDCGISDITINCRKKLNHQHMSVDLSSDFLDWKTHPFSKIITDDSFASSICYVVGDYTDNSGSERKIEIYDLKQSHILRQFVGQTSVFKQVKFTKSLELVGIHLRELKAESFINFSMLTDLYIRSTSLTSIGQNAFAGLKNLMKLNITNNKALQKIDKNALPDLESIEHLNISNNAIIELKDDTLKSLTSLKTIDLRGNNLRIRTNYFKTNGELILINADSYAVCCMKPTLITSDNCKAPKDDAISGCYDLIDDEVLRIFLWLIGITAAFGNIIVILYRFTGDTKSTNETFITFVTNLSVSDAMMGFYMLVIAVHDAKFKGEYVWHEYDWKNSLLCELSGTVSFVSSESSVLFILFITIDRILAVKYPIGGPRITTKKAHLMSLFSWAISLLTAVIPGQLYHKFYSYSGVCIALPLSVNYVDGKFYSVAVFLGFNFVVFLVIAFGQFAIFREIQLSSRRVRAGTFTSRDRDASTMLLMVVITDCFCWLPIGVLVIMALCGINTPNVIYAWIIVFVMPVNSAINPFLYTIGPEVKKWLREKVVRTGVDSNERAQKIKSRMRKSEEDTKETPV